MYVVFSSMPLDSKFTTKYLRQILLVNSWGAEGKMLKKLFEHMK